MRFETPSISQFLVLVELTPRCFIVPMGMEKRVDALAVYERVNEAVESSPLKKRLFHRVGEWASKKLDFAVSDNKSL